MDPQQQVRELRSLEEVPSKYRVIFSSYPCFNAVQSQVIDDVLYTDHSIVLAAPTGSGKTVVFELAIIELLIRREFLSVNNDFKIIYIAPVKALCTERFTDWSERLACIGITCIEVTGDTGDFYDFQGYNLILTTPEKWDSLTRRWRDNLSLVQRVKLLLIDELHLLNDNKRGPILEAIICRMKTVVETLKHNFSELDSNLRLVGVSGTIYNADDVAEWFSTKNKPACHFKFGNELRPVKLKQIVKGYELNPKQNPFMFDISLSYKLKPLILENSVGKPVLIFCSTRKGVQQTSQIISQQIAFQFTPEQNLNLQQVASMIQETKLREIVTLGVGYHHAGMSVQDRLTIQNAFSVGSLPVLVATSTLAMGVNLPAHLVIIKSTHHFLNGAVKEYSETELLQMVGRAGRPQFDDSATAIIMTQTKMVKKYEQMLDCKDVLESNLHHHLTEHLNSEIVLYTITDLSVAIEWIRSTFFYIRAKKNPKHYGFDSSSTVERKLYDICLRELNALKAYNLVDVSENGVELSPTSRGRLLSHYYLSLETFKLFYNFKGGEDLSDIILSICEAKEFDEVTLRMSERCTLNSLNRSSNRECIRFPIPGKIKSKAMKVNCLIQACLSGLPIDDPGLHQESVRIVNLAERISRCLSEFLSSGNLYKVMMKATILAKCLSAKLWENSPLVSRQLNGIGATLGSLLAACGKVSFQNLENSNPRDLERILNRAPCFGNKILDTVLHLPKYNVVIDSNDNAINYCLEITVSLENLDVVIEKNTAGDMHCFSFIIGDSNNKLLAYHKVCDKSLFKRPFEITITLSNTNMPEKVYVDLISEKWVGLDIHKQFELLPQTITLSDTSQKPFKSPKSSYDVANGFSQFSNPQKINISYPKSPQEQPKKLVNLKYSSEMTHEYLSQFSCPQKMNISDPKSTNEPPMKQVYLKDSDETIHEYLSQFTCPVEKKKINHAGFSKKPNADSKIQDYLTQFIGPVKLNRTDSDKIFQSEMKKLKPNNNTAAVSNLDHLKGNESELCSTSIYFHPSATNSSSNKTITSYFPKVATTFRKQEQQSVKRNLMCFEESISEDLKSVSKVRSVPFKQDVPSEPGSVKYVIAEPNSHLFTLAEAQRKASMMSNLKQQSQAEDAVKVNRTIDINDPLEFKEPPKDNFQTDMKDALTPMNCNFTIDILDLQAEVPLTSVILPPTSRPPIIDHRPPNLINDSSELKQTVVTSKCNNFQKYMKDPLYPMHCNFTLDEDISDLSTKPPSALAIAPPTTPRKDQRPLNLKNLDVQSFSTLFSQWSSNENNFLNNGNFQQKVSKAPVVLESQSNSTNMNLDHSISIGKQNVKKIPSPTYMPCFTLELPSDEDAF